MSDFLIGVVSGCAALILWNVFMAHNPSIMNWAMSGSGWRITGLITAMAASTLTVASIICLALLWVLV